MKKYTIEDETGIELSSISSSDGDESKNISLQTLSQDSDENSLKEKIIAAKEKLENFGELSENSFNSWINVSWEPETIEYYAQLATFFETIKSEYANIFDEVIKFIDSSQISQLPRPSSELSQTSSIKQEQKTELPSLVPYSTNQYQNEEVDFKLLVQDANYSLRQFFRNNTHWTKEWIDDIEENQTIEHFIAERSMVFKTLHDFYEKIFISHQSIFEKTLKLIHDNKTQKLELKNLHESYDNGLEAEKTLEEKIRKDEQQHLEKTLELENELQNLKKTAEDKEKELMQQVRELSLKLDNLQDTYNKYASGIEQNIKELDREVLDLTNKNNELSNKTNELQKTNKELTKEHNIYFNAITTLDHENNKLKEEIQVFRNTKNQLESELKNQNEVNQQLNSENSQLKEGFNQQAQKIATQEKELKKLHEQNIKLTKDFNVRFTLLEEENTGLQKELLEVKEQKDRLLKSVGKINEEKTEGLREIYNQNNDLREQNEILKTENQKLKSQFESVNQLQNEKFEQEKRELEKKLNEEKEALEQKSQQQIEELNQRNKKLEDSLKKSTQSIRRLRNGYITRQPKSIELKEFTTEIIEPTQQIEKNKQEEELEEANQKKNKELDEARKIEEELKKKLQEKELEETNQKKNKELDEAHKIEEELKKKLQEKEESETQLNAEKEALKQELETIKTSSKNEKETLREEIKELKTSLIAQALKNMLTKTDLEKKFTEHFKPDYKKASKLLFENKAEELAEEIKFYKEKRYDIYKNTKNKKENLEELSEEKVKEIIFADRIKVVKNCVPSLITKFLGETDIDNIITKLTPTDIVIALSVGNSKEFEEWKDKNPDSKIIDNFHKNPKSDKEISPENKKILRKAIENLFEGMKDYATFFGIDPEKPSNITLVTLVEQLSKANNKEKITTK